MSLSRKEGSRKFAELLFEVVPISAGVFLGLWADSWHEEREHRAHAKAALGNFLEEMQLNLQPTEQNRRYHERWCATWDNFLRAANLRRTSAFARKCGSKECDR